MSTKRPKSPSSDAAEAPKPPDRTTLKNATKFLGEVEKMLKKHGAKVAEKDREKLQIAIEAVRAAIAQADDRHRLANALRELDNRVDQILGFAKKSAGREYFESIFVAVLIAVVLRSFVVEAFKIPTGSMIPTLQVGDHIFVNKFTYGLRVPFTNWWFAEWGLPERGDVIVFRYPNDPSKDYIKRVVAIAGDEVRVVGQEVFVNESKLERAAPAAFEYVEEGEDELFSDRGADVIRKALGYSEKSLGTNQDYTVLYEHHGYARPPFPSGQQQLPGLACAADVGTCKVEPNFVFVMGDNRDNSSDSRVWGGVPTSFVKGKAMFIWWSLGPRTGVRWDRLGKPVH